VARAYITSQSLKLLGYKGFAKFARGEASPEHSVLKLLASECRRDLARDMAEELGPEGIDRSRHDAPPVSRGDDETWVEHWLHAFSGTIAGGTSEIQRNIIAERVLGMPRR
jgi:alkylation response protein AidB-like acyl-CoA dehydrogenase